MGAVFKIQGIQPKVDFLHPRLGFIEELNMDENIAQEILHELFSSLEDLETQSAAVLQFLKNKGIANDKELTPYIERAGNASSVRWRGVRARIDYLLASAMKNAEESGKKPAAAPASSPGNEKPNDSNVETSTKKETEEDISSARETTAKGEKRIGGSAESAGNGEKEEGNADKQRSKATDKNAA
jgi:hypothetical protein